VHADPTSCLAASCLAIKHVEGVAHEGEPLIGRAIRVMYLPSLLVSE